MTHLRRWLSAAPALGLLLGSLASSCSPASSGGGQGGAPTTGGTPSSGGANTPTGGTTGGAVAPTGGTPTTGGLTATGGSAGMNGTGGTTGGSSSTGGNTGGGGPSTGGASGGATGGTAGAAGGGAGGAAAGAGGATAGAGAGGGSAGSSSSGFLSEGFESGTNGMQPAGWDNFIAYQKNIKNPADDGSLAVVDSTRAHSGTKSLKVHSTGGPVMLTRPLPNGTNKLYVRGYFYMTRQLGMNPGANHETLLGIRKAVGSANDEVRFGEIKGVIGTNEVPSDNISPKMDQWGKGPVVAANTWACIEVAFLADQAQHQLQAWVGDTLVHSITAPDQWQNGVMPADWMKGKFVEFIIGWQSFSSAANDLWIDDLVLSNSKIGCN
ncbi:MAG TPA: hypothetical protein VG937_04745 [Polyangiaceae bacterium]|nr:hypothetical protein [Polyangiaceae bacterium]